jgi:2-oxoglutarate dehydrogenase E2 component (dihydrolipoamide succinyltransferase)
MPKFKLKFKKAAPAADPAAEAPAPQASAEAAAEPAPEYTPPAPGGDAMVGAPTEEAAPARPKLVQLRLSEDQLPPLEPGEVKVPKPKVPKKALTAGVIGAVAAVMVIFGGSAYFTHRLRDMAPAPKPVVVAPPPKPVEAEVVVEKEPVETPEEIAAKKAAAAAKRKPPPPKVAPVTAAASTTNLGGGVSVTTSDDVAAATNASPEFRSWVAGAKIGGVFQGASPRVLINGRTVRAGTTVDETLGIVFDSVNAANKTIIFKDSTGAVVERHY